MTNVHIVCNNWLPFGAPFELGPEIYGIYWNEEDAVEHIGRIARDLGIPHDGESGFLDAKNKSHETNYYYIDKREVL